MVEESAAERPFVLSMLPAPAGERRIAVALALLSLVICAVLAPFARLPLLRVAAFIPSYEAALIICDLVTAMLLFGQFIIARSRALLALASGYFFAAAMTVAHALSFPGLFAESGLLGAGPQSTAWLYMFWHAGFPGSVLLYALLKRSGPTRLAAPVAIMSCVVLVLALVAALTALATAGAAALPPIMAGNAYTPAMIFVVGTVWSFSLAALFVLIARRAASILDLWLIVVLCAWLSDVALSALLNAGRFDLGFYAGRVYGLAAASLVLVVLLLETVTLYTRLARSLAAEGQERERHLGELRSELIHLSRLSELGQMVSALAHEVNQPLTAIGNYTRAGQRLLQMGETAKAQSALGKAAEETIRAREIIQRLRDFTKKSDSEMRAEPLRPVIEETIALAIVGAERHDVGVELRLDPQVPAAIIDKIQIQQVLLNLIRNAIEAMAESPRQSLVIAAAPAAQDMVEISVADTGPGLSAEVRAKLFKPFVTTKSSGMGVGLSICRSIIEVHGGRIWAEDNPGGGTLFRFTVPRAPLELSRGAAA
jgi:signal transduction histidine kinase